MAEGWVKLYRKSRHSAVFKDDSLWKLWCYLLMEANYAERQLPDGTTLKPGQLVRGYRRIASDLGWSKGKAERKVRRLLAQKRIEVGRRTGTLAQVVTICNWETYQGDKDESGTLNGTLVGTLAGRKRDASRDIKKKERKKEGKKGRNVRNVIPPKLTDIQAYCTERKNGIDPQDFVDHYTRQGWKLSNGVKMTDWQAAVRTWERNQKDDRKQPKLFGTKGPDPGGPCKAI